MQKPSIAELLSAWGYATYTPELIQRAMSTLYGHVGANLDGRNWAAILQSANPLEAAEAALLAMYQNSAYLVSNIEHLAQKGYVPAQAELTYRQLAERVGFTHNNGWSVGTAYDGLSQKSTPQLLAEVPPPAPKTFTVTNNAGTLAFGGTATGDITFTVAADGTATLVRGGVTAATTVDVAAITDAGGTIKLAVNATGLSVAQAGAMIAITGFDANGFTFSISDTAAAVAGAGAAVLNGATNIEATGTADVAQATAIEAATNTGTTTIAALTDTAAAIAGSTDAVLNLVAGAVTATGNATAAQATTLEGFTKPVVYSISDTAAAVVGAGAALLGGAVNIAATGAAIDVVQAQTILGAVNTGTTTIDAVTDTATMVAMLTLGAGKNIATITANTAATASEAAALHALADGDTTVDYFISDTAVAVAGAGLGVIGAANSITVTGAATAAQLNTIHGATGIIVNATGVTPITGLATDFGTLLTAWAGTEITLSPSFAATVTDPIANASVVNTLLGATTGVVTANLAGPAGTLNSQLSNGDPADALTITLAAGSIDIADIVALNGKTSVDINAMDVSLITSAAPGLIDLTAPGVTWASNINVMGSTGNDTTIGTAGIKVITGGLGKDDMTGGLGADIYVFNLGDTGKTTTTADIIRGFVSGTDKLQMGVAGDGTNFVAHDANTAIVNDGNDVTSVEAAVAIFQLLLTGKRYGYVYDSNGGVDGYLVVDSNTDGTADFVITLAGLTTAGGLAATDIIA